MPNNEFQITKVLSDLIKPNNFETSKFERENSGDLQILPNYNPPKPIEQPKSLNSNPPKLERENSGYLLKSAETLNDLQKSYNYAPPKLDRENSGDLNKWSRYDPPRLQREKSSDQLKQERTMMSTGMEISGRLKSICFDNTYIKVIQERIKILKFFFIKKLFFSIFWCFSGNYNIKSLQN